MVELDNIDIETEPSIRDIRKNTLTKLHNLRRNLEEKVRCTSISCVICKTGINNDDTVNNIDENKDLI